MATSTPRLTLPLPVGSDAPSELRIAIGQLSNGLDSAAVYSSGTISARAGLTPVAGQLYYATDIFQWAVYNGTAWQPLRGLTGTFQTGSTYTAKDGDLVETGATGAMTITLPNVATAHTVGVTNFSGHAVTVQRAGSATINGPGLAGVTQFPLSQPGSFVVLNSDEANWFVTAGGPDAGWVDLGIPAGWAAFGVISGASPFPPQARLVADRVWLRGACQNNTGGTASFTGTVPSPCVPSHTVSGVVPLLSAAGVASTVAGDPSPVNIGNTGGIGVYTSVATGNGVAFDGFSYSVA